MRPETLLRLYPRAWRERYGEEFLATIGPEALGLQQVIDMVSGAIDAWLSADVRRATAPASVARTGGLMNVKALIACDRKPARYTNRDALIGAGVMVAATLILTTLGTIVTRRGWPSTGETILNLSYFAALMLSMPFWLMKGQPWKAQGVIMGVMVMLITAATYLASR